jgi:hypothetical protein
MLFTVGGKLFVTSSLWKISRAKLLPTLQSSNLVQSGSMLCCRWMATYSNNVQSSSRSIMSDLALETFVQDAASLETPSELPKTKLRGVHVPEPLVPSHTWRSTVAALRVCSMVLLTTPRRFKELHKPQARRERFQTRK